MITGAYWRQSAARKLVFAALMIAAYVALSAVFIPIGGEGGPRILIRFLPQVLIGAICGPVAGFAAGFAADWLGFIIYPTGMLMPGLLLTAAVRGLLYGLFLYRKPMALSLTASSDSLILRFALCQFAVNALCHVGMNVVWRTVQNHPAFFPYYWVNLQIAATSNLVQWPFQVILMVALCKALWPVLRRLGWVDGEEMKAIGSNQV
jgi:ECF transporter S component (folate family)